MKKGKKEKGIAVARFRKRAIANLAIMRFQERATVTFHLNNGPPTPGHHFFPKSLALAAVSPIRCRPLRRRLLPAWTPATSPSPPEAVVILTAAA